MPDSGGSSPEQALQRPQLVVADRFGRVVETRPIPQPEPQPTPPTTTERQAPRDETDVIDQLADAVARKLTTRESRPQPEAEQRLEQTLEWYVFYDRKEREDPDSLTQEEKESLGRLRGLLGDVREYACSFYSQVRSSPPQQRLMNLRQIKTPDFEVDFWTHSRHREAASQFRGIRNFYFSSFWEAFEKDIEGQPLDLQKVGDREYLAIKNEREAARLKEPKFRRERNAYADEFHWAENRQEMVMSVHEWLASVEKELPEESAGKVADFINEKRRDGLGMLSRLRVRLNAEFGLNIDVDDSIYKRMRKLLEARLNVLGGQLVNRGGWDYYIAYFGDFAVNFVDHYDAIYLEDSLIPAALHKLGENDGIYWRGCEPNVERPSDGEVRAFQNRAEERIVDFLSTHELAIKTRVERILWLLKNSPEDKLKEFKQELMRRGLPEDIDGREYDDQYKLVFAIERDEFLRTNSAFQKTRQRYDAQEGLRGLTDEERMRRIQEIIRSKIQEVDPQFLAKILGDERQQDRELWRWVEGYNKGRSDKWFPSTWDRIRLSIDRPEKVLSRALSQEEFESMYEAVNFEGMSQKAVEALRQERKERAQQALEVAKRTQIFFGVASRYGGTRLRITDENGDVVAIKPKFAEVRDRIYKLIQEDANKPIEKQKFRVHHAMKELGLANKLPIWSYYLVNDDPTIAVFAEIMGIPADEKQKLIALVEEERRQLRRVEDQVVEEFMKGKTKKGWRKRINHKGGNIDLRKIWDAPYIFSTSGGVLSADLVPYMHLGIYDMLWEMGCEDFREFSGWIKRRDEVEAEHQALWNVLDPIDYHKRLNEAEALRKYASGTKTKDGREVPGFLNGPLSGAFEIRDAFVGTSIINNEMANSIRFDDAVTRKSGSASPEEVERLRQDTYDDFDKMDSAAKDKFMKLCTDRLQPLLGFMKNRSYVENRLINKEVTSNFLYDNTLLWYAFRRWLRASKEYKDKFNFAPHAKTELVIRFYEVILEDAEHLILPKEERLKLFPEEEARMKSDTPLRAVA